MKTIFYTFFFFAISSIANAQQAPIMVCNPAGTICAPYTDLTTAYNDANAGDYIYIPGGNFSISVEIAKEIHFRGAGFHNTASVTTGTTNISGNITLAAGSSNSSFEGFYLFGDFTQNTTINNITVKYCNFNSFGNTVPNITINNSLILNCVSRANMHFGFTGTEGTNNTVKNSYINCIAWTQNSMITNNISTSVGNQFIWESKNTIVKNNVILYANPGISSGSTNITFNNNIYFANGGSISCTNCIYNNNYSYTAFRPYTTVFANNFTTDNYQETVNYQILPTSPAKNGGDDGTDIGIYGGSTPWKDGAIPSNPRIFFKNIANTTDVNGNLPVQIKVSAQN
jgi:hypothetical protein